MKFLTRHHWSRLTPLLALVLMLCLATCACACPTCKQGLAENDPALRNMAAGYYYSILFMMAMPFVILGTFGGFAYLSIRRAREAAEAASANAE